MEATLVSLYWIIKSSAYLMQAVYCVIKYQRFIFVGETSKWFIKKQHLELPRYYIYTDEKNPEFCRANEWSRSFKWGNLHKHLMFLFRTSLFSFHRIIVLYLSSSTAYYTGESFKTNAKVHGGDIFFKFAIGQKSF